MITALDVLNEYKEYVKIIRRFGLIVLKLYLKRSDNNDTNEP